MITLRKVTLHVGRRGVFLILFGVVYGLLGYSYLQVPVTPAVHRALHVALNVAPLSVYAWAWITAGIICAAAGLLSPRRKPVGFAVAMLMPALWAAVFLIAWVNGDMPRGWTSAVVFAALAGAVGVVAGMQDTREMGLR